jgi:hypothetical protein
MLTHQLQDYVKQLRKPVMGVWLLTSIPLVAS